MKEKLQVGDLVLVTGPAHYEKATVISVEKGLVTLDNQMKIDHKYNNLVKSIMQAKPWNEEEFNYLHSNAMIKKYLSGISRNYNKLSKEEIISLNNKLKRISEKFNLGIF